MSGTHVNAYKADVEEAYTKAVSAVSEFKTKVDSLVAKFESDASETDASTPTPESAPAQSPKPSDTPVGPGSDQSTKTK